MTFGIYTKGDVSQMLISSEVNSLVFIGKATFVSREGVIGTPPGYPPQYFGPYGTSFLNFPISAVCNFTFNSGGRDAIFFVYTPSPYKSALISASRSGSTYTIGVLSQPAGITSLVPEVYCFSATNSAGNVGNGVTVKKSDGSTSFTSSDKVLIIDGYYSGTFPYSSLRNFNYQNFNYAANGPSATSANITYIAPQNTITASISKPILYMPSYQTARLTVGGSQSYLYELGGLYNTSTKNLELEWITPFFGFIGAGLPAYQTNARTGFAMVADGADYD